MGRSFRPIIIAAGLLAMAAAAWWLLPRPGGRATGHPATRPNVLLVSIDTLRADRTGGALTPSLNALAARGTRFLNARSPVPLTLPAHASLMTGLLPPRHGVRLNGAHRLAAGTPTLATVLRGAGYRTGAFVGAYVLDPRFGLAEGFDTYDAEIARRDEVAGEPEAERRGEAVVDRAVAWLASQPPGAPFFLWVHLYDPHAPYDPPSGWTERAGGNEYDGEVAYADAQLGRLLESLASQGQASPTVIVVAGDHGEALGDHGEATHGLLIYEKAVAIPLVVAGAGAPVAVRDDAASLVDVAPTVMGLLKLEGLGNGDGRDLFAPGAASMEAEIYLETEYPAAAGFATLKGLVSGRWKYIGDPERPELYDLLSDPDERSGVGSRHGPTLEAMAARVRAIGQAAAPPSPAGPSAEAVERLRALGYVTPGPVAPLEGHAGRSPRALVEIWPAFQIALADTAAGRHERALPVLARLARDFPESLLFRSSYGRSLDEAGRGRESIEVYRGALTRWPDNTVLLQGYATAARAAGLFDEAMKAERAVLALDPGDAAAENGIGLLYADQGRARPAREAFRRAVTLDPHVVSYWVNLGNACRQAGETSEADEAYRRALALDAGSVDAMNGIGVLLVQQDRPGEAAPWFERAVGASPTFAEAWLNLGIARHEAGDRPGAAEAYRRVLALPGTPAKERGAARQLLATLRSPDR